MRAELLHFSEVTSTNSEAAQLLKENRISRDTIIHSDFQHSGRGQGSHRWISDRRKNLLMSWVIFPAFLSVDRQFQLSKLVSVAISEVLETHGLKVQIKWPNDILVDLKKIGGVLIEHAVMGNRLKHSVIGIGLNIMQDSFPEFPIPATSMQAETGTRISPDEIMEKLVTRLYQYYDRLQLPQKGWLDSIYLDRLFGYMKKRNFMVEKQIVEGIITGVTDTGELKVKIDGMEKVFGLHSIETLLR